MRHSKLVWLFILPALGLMLVFALAPSVMALLFAFTNQRLIPAPQLPTQWVGLLNFGRLLEDQGFLIALRNTALFTLALVPLQTALALLLALLINQKRPWMNWFRAIYFLPTTLSLVVTALAWSSLLQQQGLLNALLVGLGFGLFQPLEWLNHPNTALPSIVLMALWQGVGLEMLIFLAALRGIPAQLYEAAAIDGASTWQRFRFVTLPSLRNAMVLVVVTLTIKAVQQFDLVFAVGASDHNKTLVYLLYETGFRTLLVGKAAAIAFVIFAVLALTIAFQRWSLREPASRPLAIGRQTVWPRWFSVKVPTVSLDHRWMRLLQSMGVYALMTLLALFFALPIWLMLVSAFKLDNDQLARDLGSWLALVPYGKLGWNWFGVVLQEPLVLRGLLNSTLIVAVCIPLVLLVNSLFAYGLARFHFWGRRSLIALVIALNILPFSAIVIPLLLIVVRFDWTDTYHVQMVPFIFSALITFLFFQFFQKLPPELEEAAWVDGANWWTIYWRVALPLSAPVFATAGILTFLSLWGSVLWPVMSLRSPELFPITTVACYVGICGSINRLEISGLISAVGIVMALPPLLMFLVFQRWYIRSISAGAVVE